MKILFMGTPDFALFSLKALCESGEDVIGVVTQPDKPKGRGYTLAPPPVKVYAESVGIPVYQPATLRGEEFAALLSQLDPELIAVAAYGKILPANVLDYPKYGCLNVHGSLLPEYRGAAPMQRAIMEGKKQTGITIQMMDIGLDTGDMIVKRAVDILPNDNFEDVHDKLGAVGAEALIEAINLIKCGKATREKQDDSLATYAAKIEKADCLIDFSQSSRAVHDRIRGLSPMPLAFTHTSDGKILKIIVSEVSERVRGSASVGEVVSVSGGVITVACGDGCINILKALPEGKGRMSASDLVNGRRVALGDVLA